MEFYRYILLVLENEERKFDLLNGIPNWEYCDTLDSDLLEAGYSFTLISKEENIEILFKKIKDCVYTSINVLPYSTDNVNEISEPHEEDIHNDVLFKLCLSIIKKYVNFEVRCGIIPCEND